jgi:hypothetical protein
MNKLLLTGAALALNTAAMFVLAPAFAADPAATGATSAPMVYCKTATNDCKDPTDCKDKGFVPMSKEDCEKAGGSVVE